MKTKPYKHQADIVEWSNDREQFALLCDMGCGKSWMLMAHAERGYERMDYDCLFIVAPKGVYTNWPNKEIPTHMSINHKCFTWSSSMTKVQKKKMLYDLEWCKHKLRVVVLNVESLVSEEAMEFAEMVLTKYQCLFALDESTVIKTENSSRTKSMIELSECSESHRVIMTGSPITNSPYDLYSQCYFLNPKFLGFSTYLAFRNYYSKILTIQKMADGTYNRVNGPAAWTKGVRSQYEKVIEYKNLDHLNEKLKQFSFRILKKDCLDLPPKIYQTREVEMSKEQAKAYDEMASKWLVEIEGTSVTAQIALVKLMKLHHILCGFLKDDYGNMIQLKSNRTKALLEVIDESPSKRIIWANYKYDISTIRQALLSAGHEPDSIVEFHGDTSDSDRETAKIRFQEDPSCLTWLGTPKAGARGNTLTAGSLMIFYSYDFNRDHRWQAEDRAHRIGMSEPLTIVDLVVPNTIDEIILKAHKTTELIAHQVVDEVREFLRSAK